MKKLVYLLIIVAAVAVVVLLGYFLRYRAEEPAPGGTTPKTGSLPDAETAPKTTNGKTAATTTAGGQTGGQNIGEQTQQPQVRPGEQKFGVIAQNPVAEYFVDEENNVIMVQPDGKVVKVSRGETSVISSSEISGLSEAKFSHDGKHILVAFGSGQTPEHSIFSIENKTWSPLEAGIKSPAWSPYDNRIAYIKEVGGANAIFTADPSIARTKPQEIIKLNTEDVRLIWLSPQKLVIADKGSVFSGGSLWLLDIKTKTLSQVVRENLGLDYKWSGEALLGLVFKTDLSRRGGVLALYDASGNLVTNLSILTMPSKCGFDVVPGQTNGTSTAAASKFLYCAIPANTDLLKTKTLPDEYQKRAFFTKDDFFKIDLRDGSVSGVFSGENVDVDNLKVFGGNLFFINRMDGKLYAISLEK